MDRPKDSNYRNNPNILPVAQDSNQRAAKYGPQDSTVTKNNPNILPVAQDSNQSQAKYRPQDSTVTRHNPNNLPVAQDSNEGLLGPHGDELPVRWQFSTCHCNILNKVNKIVIRFSISHLFKLENF